MGRTGLALLLTALVAGTAGCGSSSDDGRISDASTQTPDVAADVTPTPTATATSPASTTPATSPGSTSPSGGVSTDDPGQGIEGNGTPGSNAGAGSSSGSACASANLKASLDFTTGGGAAGSTTGNLVLTNTGSSSCTLYGYPGVSFVDGGGKQLGAAAARSGAAAKTVTVRAGDAAFAELKIADVLNYDDATCGRTTATGFRVYPPGEKAALFVERSTKACTKDVAVLTVGPVSTDG
ncbi:MAG: DUF4232 domain-containing protein [Solirubrobacteraceae bacterium]|nr:DUF4232 domain-containing protein [Patulibacter sp.]